MVRKRAVLAITATSLLAVSACGGAASEPDGGVATVAPTMPSTPGPSTPGPSTPAPATDAPATSPDTGAPDTGTPDTADPSTTPAPPPVADIVRFSSPLVGGGELDVGAAYGGAPVAFWFWAPS